MSQLECVDIASPGFLTVVYNYFISLTGKKNPVFVQFKLMEEKIQRDGDVEKINPKKIFTFFNDCSVIVD